MEIKNLDGIQFFDTEVIEFEYDSFIINYEDNKWFAENKDPENDDVIVIEDEETSMDKDIELFNNFILTIYEFNTLKEVIKNDK